MKTANYSEKYTWALLTESLTQRIPTIRNKKCRQYFHAPVNSWEEAHRAWQITTPNSGQNVSLVFDSGNFQRLSTPVLEPCFLFACCCFLSLCIYLFFWLIFLTPLSVPMSLWGTHGASSSRVVPIPRPIFLGQGAFSCSFLPLLYKSLAAFQHNLGWW